MIATLSSLVALVAGGLITSAGSGDWYRELAKPSWQPPAWVFSTAWTLIFALKTVALWLVARHGLERPEVRTAVVIYACQWLLNVAWSVVFFTFQSPAAALVEIAVLDGFVLATIGAFARVSRGAALLMAPYAVWLVLATAINTWIVVHAG